jgi:hypothetical protein
MQAKRRKGQTILQKKQEREKEMRGIEKGNGLKPCVRRFETSPIEKKQNPNASIRLLKIGWFT